MLSYICSIYTYTMPKNDLDTYYTYIVEQISQSEKKIFSRYPIYHSIALNLYFVARIKISIEKRFLVNFLRFLVKPLIFCPKKLFRHFYYSLSISIKILSKIAHSIEKIVVYMIISFTITNINSDS